MGFPKVYERDNPAEKRIVKSQPGRAGGGGPVVKDVDQSYSGPKLGFQPLHPIVHNYL